MPIIMDNQHGIEEGFFDLSLTSTSSQITETSDLDSVGSVRILEDYSDIVFTGEEQKTKKNKKKLSKAVVTVRN